MLPFWLKTERESFDDIYFAASWKSCFTCLREKRK